MDGRSMWCKKPKAFQALLKAVNRSFGKYVLDENDCSDYAVLCAKLAPEHDINVVIKQCEIRGGQRHVAVEYRDNNNERWIGDVIFRRPVPKARYEERLNVRWW